MTSFSYYSANMDIMQTFMQRIRPILGLKSWDYSVLWKLSHDQRFLEWVDCCCGGIENTNGGEELHFSASTDFPCRDVIFQHQRTKSCDLLAQLQTSISLDSGNNHARALLSNQASWLRFTYNSDANISEETIGTRVLIPLPVGLIELFTTKQEPEDQQVIDLITTQCNIMLEQQTLVNSNSMESNYSINVNPMHENFIPAEETDQNEHTNSMNFLNNLSYNTDNGNKNGVFFEEPTDLLNPLMKSSSSMGNNNDNGLGHVDMHNMMDSFGGNEEGQGLYENCFKYNGNTRSNSNSDTDMNDDEEDQKGRRRNGKGPAAKNLMAERKRRKKLNERLYTLRALVPKISKLDRASILGDAIDYVKELEQQAKELQDELEEQSDDEGQNGNLHQNGISQGKVPNGCHNGLPTYGVGESSKQNQESENSNDKVQQMEPQVEVAQLDGNEFFVKVFCEHKAGGFVRLLEALNSLGFEVTNVNATRHTCLVSNIFKVEKKDSEAVQADIVRDSLLELTRNPTRGWSDLINSPVNGNGMDRHQQQIHHAQVHNYSIDPHLFNCKNI
ncbi:hypothetical protein Leryth_009245 [Lithospermum erythrorhizon]|nr:hypothetical protein Leryth_009245 [Lithospermum erythrorhizon]